MPGMENDRKSSRVARFAATAAFMVVFQPALSAAAVSPEEQRTVVLHTVEKVPDDERGVLRLARYDNTSHVSHGDTVVTSVNYHELCSMPCGVPVDVSDRPILFFVRDGRPVSSGFRIPKGADEFTIKVKPGRRGMVGAGVLLTGSIAFFPIGVPLWIAGASRAWIAEGSPGDESQFVRLKRARR